MIRKCISITSSGMMGCYCAGVLDFLVKEFPESLKDFYFHGASSGALLAGLYKLTLNPPSSLLRAFTDFYNKKRKSTKDEPAYLDLVDSIKEFGTSLSHEKSLQDQKLMLDRVNDGRLYIHVARPKMQFLPLGMFGLSLPLPPALEGESLYHWDSLEDFFETLAQSCAIPFKTCTWDRAMASGMDGGFTDRCPQLTDDLLPIWNKESKTPFFVPMPLPSSLPNAMSTFVLCENRWRQNKFNLFHVLDMSFDTKKQNDLIEMGLADAAENRGDIEQFIQYKGKLPSKTQAPPELLSAYPQPLRHLEPHPHPVQ